jgi:hypothetical protein
MGWVWVRHGISPFWAFCIVNILRESGLFGNFVNSGNAQKVENTSNLVNLVLLEMTFNGILQKSHRVLKASPWDGIG